MLKRVAVFCLFLSFGYTTALPYITKCKAADSVCLKKSAQEAIQTFVKGIPELGVETLDPFKIKNTIDASTSGLKLLLKDLTVTGLSGCLVRKLERNVEKKKIHAVLECNADLIGQYEMNGQLLIIPVQGNGKLEVNLRKLVLDVVADLGEKKKNGKSYWDIKKFTHNFNLEAKSNIHFENLLTGSEVLGRAASDVIENSSNDIILEVGPPVVQALAVKIISNIRHFFNNVLSDELTLDH